MKIALALLLALLLSGAKPSLADTHSERVRTAALLATADDLLATATAISENTPSTSIDAAGMVNGDQGVAGRFYARDRKFQDDLRNLSPGLIKDDKSRSAVLDLTQAETFLYSAVQDAVASCNKHDARLDLKVARADILEAHRDFNGTGRGSDFQPPEIETNGDTLCRE
jgi:hypothetical protein